MSRHIFLVFFLLLFVCCTLCQQTCAAHGVQVQSETGGDTFDDFLKPGNKEILQAFKSSETSELHGITVDNIESVFFLAVDGVMAALAEMNNKGQSDRKTYLLAKYIETKNDGWGERALKKETSEWNVQLNKEAVLKPKGGTVMKSFAVAAIKEKTFYHFTLSNDVEKAAQDGFTDKLNVKLLLNKFAITGGTGETAEWTSKTISGSYDKSQPNELKTSKSESILFSDNFAFVIADKIYIVSVMKSTEAPTGDNNKKYIAVFQLDENSSKEKLELLRVENIESCYPLFFQWKGEIYKAPTGDSKCNKQELMVFCTSNSSFTQSKSSIARLRDFLKDKNFFVNATIEGSDVLLFIQQKTSEEDDGNNAHLWMTDGSRVNSVDVIVPNIKDKFYGSLLYTNNELFLLYQANEESGQENNKIYLSRLNMQLNKIKSVLRNWNESNAALKERCGNTDITAIPCFTDGLVGVLSNNKENNDFWRDDYLNMGSAIITIDDRDAKKAEKVKNVQNGFKFTGEGAGARWSVGVQSQDQPYNFTDPGFTLVATVSINDNVNNASNSVMGMGLKKKTGAAVGSTKNIRLWCTEKKKWAVSEENEENEENEKILKDSAEKCEQGKTYIVAFVLNENENLEVYINGKPPTGFENKKIKIEKGDTIKYFYFGADDDVEKVKTDVTITNVLLYNRPFNTSEIETLKLNDRPDTQRRDINNDNNQQENNGSTTENFSPNTSATKKEDEAQSSSKTTEDTAVRVSVLFLLLGIFAFWGCYI